MEHLDARLTPDERPQEIQDPAEVARWLAAGRTPQWMAEEYERRYNITAPASLFARPAPPARTPGPTLGPPSDLIPWAVLPQHRLAYSFALLRMEQRRREGQALGEVTEARLKLWRAHLGRHDLVVHYDPGTEEGFFFVPRRHGVDDDLVRRPDVT